MKFLIELCLGINVVLFFANFFLLRNNTQAGINILVIIVLLIAYYARGLK